MSSSDVSSVVNYFATAHEGFSSSLDGGISSGATSLVLTDISGLTNGDIFVGIIEPGQTNEQVFTGTVVTSTNSITDIVWTRGTNVDHATGVTVVDYVTGTAFNMMSLGILQEHNQDGTHGTVHATSLAVDTISEKTSAAGVTIDSVLLKDGLVQHTGAIQQFVYNETGAKATGTTGIPFDDTVPQNTEGDQYMSQAITPKSATNVLKIEVTACLSPSIATHVIGALFQDSTAGALAVVPEYVDTNTGTIVMRFTHTMVAGTTSSTTFKFRAGKKSGDSGTLTFNGQSGGRLFGGVECSSMQITEYKAS